jgi:hypothetical protein
MANEPTVGTSDFLFDAATLLNNVGYEFIILARPKGGDMVHYTAGLESKRTAEAMLDTAMAAVADRFQSELEDEDDSEPA